MPRSRRSALKLPLFGSDNTSGRKQRRPLAHKRLNVETLEERRLLAFMPGSIQGQEGWSGGNIPISPAVDQTVVQPGTAFTGVGSWRVSNSTAFGGYNGNFNGWPFGPGLTVAAGQPSSGAGADQFNATFYFNTASLSADGSNLEIDLGTVPGDDRNTFLAITNDTNGDGGLKLRMAEPNPGDPGNDFFYPTQIVATGISRGVWHRIDVEARFYDGVSNDTFSVSLDGTPIINPTPGSPNNGTALWGTFEGYRDGHGFPYALSNRLFFRSGAAPSAFDPSFVDTAAQGFFFDNVSYQVSDQSSPSVAFDSYFATFEAQPAETYAGEASDYTVTMDVGAPGLSAGDTVTWNPTGTQHPQGAVPGLIFDTHAFTSIQGAADGASVSGTVYVTAGTYDELVQVNKTLTFEGAQVGVDARTRSGSETVVQDSLGRTGFYVTASDVTIDGFTVQGQTNVNQFGAGIVLGAGTAGADVINNIVQDNVVGLFLANNSAMNQAVIAQNLFRDNDNPGSSNGTAIYTDQFVSGPTLTNIVIEDNLFTGQNFTWGINLQNATLVTIDDNAFETGNAVRLANVDNSSFTDNQFSGEISPPPPSGFQITALNITTAMSSGSTNLIVDGNSFTNRKASAISVNGLSGNLTLTDNTITQDVSLYAINTNRYMVSLTGLTGVNTVAGNTITLTGVMPSGAAVNGIAVQGNFTNTVNVAGNVLNGGNTDTFTGTNDSHGLGIFGSGLGLPSTPTPVFSTVNVSNNYINGFVDGVASPNSLNARTTVNINNNDLSGNANKAILAATSTVTPVNASGNWYGVNSPAAVASRIVGQVDYTPWLHTGTDTAPGTFGFQGDFSQLHVDDNSLQTGPTGRITEGINLLTGGSLTLFVHSGSYTENVDVNKALTLNPGDSPGIVNITGNLVFSVVGSTLALEVNGTTPGPTGHDRINVSGTVDLNGADNVNNKVTLTVSSTTPSTVLNLYDIITSGAGPVQGEFANPGDTVVSTGVVNTFFISYNPGGQNLVRLVSNSGGAADPVWVDDDWAGFANGQFIADIDPETAGNQNGYFNVNAFDTIQGGVNAVAVGGTVHVNNGLYLESVVLNDRVTIDGQSTAGVVVAPPGVDSHIDSSFSGGTVQTGFLIEADDDVTIRDLTVDGNGNGMLAGDNNYRSGVITTDDGVDDTDMLFTNLVVKNIFRRAIQISWQGTNNQISNNTITQDSGALSAGGANIGMFGGNASVAQSTRIYDNILEHSTATGIIANFGANLDIKGNQITGTPIGMNLAALDGGSIIGGPGLGDGNTIDLTGLSSADIAMLVSFSEGSPLSPGLVTVQGNTVTGSGGDSALWIFRTGATPLEVLDNNFTATGSTHSTTGEGTGVLVTDDESLLGESAIDNNANVNLSGNTISGYFYGVHVQAVDTDGPAETLNVTVGGPMGSDNNEISGSGAAGTKGVYVEDAVGGGSAVVSVQNNSSSISGFAIGVDTDGGSATVTSNSIYNNGTGIRFTNGGTGSVTSNTFDDPTAGGEPDGDADNGTDLRIDATAGSVTIGNNNSFAGDTYYIDNRSTQNFNLVGTGNTFDVSGIAPLADDNFRIEDKLFHAPDSSSSGLIRIVTGFLFVTTPGTGASDETIQRAVDAATSGDTINIEQGTYPESVTVAKSVTLNGEGPTNNRTEVVIDPPAGNAINVIAGGNNVTIRDLRVTGAVDGISATGVSMLTITNVQADTNTDDGVDLLNVSNVLFEDSLVSGHNGAGDDGLRLNNVATISVLGSTFNGNTTGVHVESGNTGVEIGPDTVVPADSNTFTVPNQAGGAVGVLVSAGQSADIQNNLTSFIGTAGPNIDTGILLDHAGDTTIDGNTFTGLYQAIRILGAAAPATTVFDIISNHFNQGDRGPGVVTDGLGIVITGDDAMGTGTPAVVQINGRGRDMTHNVFRDYGGPAGIPVNSGYAVTLRDFATGQIGTLDYDALCNDWHAGPTPPEADVPARIEDMVYDKLDEAAIGRLFAVSAQVTEVRFGAFRDLPALEVTTDLEIFPRELLPSTIVDDGDASFAASAGFTLTNGQGFQNDVRSAAGDNTGDAATWSFTGLKPGEWVELAVTWTANANRASNAQFTILDNLGGMTVLTPPVINQKVAPNDFFTRGVNWEFLTTEIQVPASGNLVVRLTDNANGFVLADAVRLQGTRQFELVQVTFYHDMVNADNVANYQLVADGVDNIHQTIPYDRTMAAPPFGLVAGDDRGVGLAASVAPSPFAGVVYNPATKTATLAIDKDLDIDHYRLLINADPATGLRAVTNNPDIDPFLLDGDGDNCDIGDDFAMDFTVSRRFDFNLAASVDDPAQSPTQPNYLAVQPQLVFASANDLDGYGWQVALPTNGFNRTGPDSLRRDGHFDSTTRTFKVDLDPGTGVSADGNGTYTVTVHIGDQTVARDFIKVFAEGSMVASLENITTAAGQFVSMQFDVTVSDGVLDLRFADGGGSDVFWVINGIEVVPTAGQIPIVLTAPSDITPGQVVTITSEPIPDKPDGSLITITPNLGAIVTPDAAANIQGHQVAVMGGVISFNLQAPLGSAATIIDNASVSGFSTAGSWTPFAGQGYQNSVLFSAAGTGSDVATWSFSNLTPGQYAVSTTWSAQANRATNAPYTVRDGGSMGPVLASVAINQEMAPNDFNDQGVPWENLAIVTITGSTMTVQLSDLANEFVIADAVRIQRVGGPVGNLEIKAVDVVGEARGTTVFPITQPADDLFFDLNSNSNATQPGYIGLNNTNNGFNFALGYGWTTLATTFDRGMGNPDQLLRDGHYGSSDNTFRVQLDPAETYNVTLRFRDTFNRDNMQVFVEGAMAPTVNIAFLPANTTNVQTFMVGPIGGDGVLDLRFHDTWISGGGGDPFWIVNAIEIDRVSPLMAAVTGSADAGPDLTQSAVDAVLAQALEIWSAALGQPVPQINVQLADLSGNLLGYANGNTITLDLNAAAVGWFIDTTPEDDSELVLIDGLLTAVDGEASQRYDLLTVLLHEVGHILGLEHDDSDEPSAMDDTLLPGVRKLPGLRASADLARIDHVLAAWD